MNRLIPIIYIIFAFFIALPLSGMPLIMGGEALVSPLILPKVIFALFTLIPFSILLSMVYVFRNYLINKGGKQPLSRSDFFITIKIILVFFVFSFIAYFLHF